MADLEKLSIIIDQINGYVTLIEDMKIKSPKDLDDLKFDAISMRIFSLLNKVIDLAEEVVRNENLGMPMKTRDLFEMLKNKKIISKEMEETVADLVLLRNTFAHRYDKVESAQIISFLKKINEINKFVETIRRYYKIK